MLPTGRSYIEEQKQDHFTLIEDIPYGDKKLAYNIALSKDWKAAQIDAKSVALTEGKSIPLALFLNEKIQNHRAQFSIQAIMLSEEISATNWLRLYAMQRAMKVLEVIEVSPIFSDALLEVTIDDEVFTVRLSVKMYGNIAFILQGLVLESLYNLHKENFGLSIISFEANYQENEKYIENRRSYKLSPHVSFELPISWESNIKDQDRLSDSVDFYRIKSLNLTGWIKVIWTDYLHDSKAIEDKILDELSKANINILKEESKHTIESNMKGFLSGHTKFYQAEIKSNPFPQEIIFSKIISNGMEVIAILLTAPRLYAFDTWAKNHRAYSILLQSLKTQ